EEEQRLYDLVNDYLQREELYAFSGSQRHLAALIIRKRLGSSTYAVASTLERVAARLAEEAASGGPPARLGDFIGDFATSDEVEGDVLDDASERFGPEPVEPLSAY